MASTKEQITAPDMPAPAAPLSHAIAAGPLLFVSGQIPRDPTTKTIPDGIEAQTRVVIQNIERVLRAGGATLHDVVKVSAHLADLRDRDAFNRVYRELMPQPFPARTTVGSQLEGIRVEIDVIAIRLVA